MDRHTPLNSPLSDLLPDPVSALEEAENRIRALLGAMPDLLFVYAPDGTYLDYHANDPSLLLAKPEEFLGRRMSEVLPAHVAGALQGAIDGTLASGSPQLARYSAVMADQRERHYEARVTKLGKDRLLALVHDVTEARRKETEFQRNHRLLEALSTLQAQTLAEAAPDASFRAMLDLLLEVTGSEAGLIGRVMWTLDGSPYVKVQALAGNPWEPGSQEYHRIAESTGDELYNFDALLGGEPAAGRPVISNHPAEELPRRALPAGFAVPRNLLALPILRREEVLGIVIAVNRPGEFSREDVDWLQPYLTTCASLFEAMRLESQRQEAVLERDQFFALSLDMLCLASRSGYFRRVNPAFERVLGYSAAELCARPYLDFVHPEDRAKTIAAAGQLNSGMDVASFENRYRCRDGSWRWMSWSVSAKPTASNLYAAVVRDVTAQKQRELELRRLSLVASKTSNAVMITDANRAIIWANQSFERITGYTLAEALGKRPGSLLHGPDTDAGTVAYMRECMAKKQGFAVEIANYSRNRTKYWVHLEVQPVFNDAGVLEFWVSIAAETTERKVGG